MPDPDQQIINGHEFWMLPIEGVRFRMGSLQDDAEAEDDEKPQHEVTIPNFYLGKYPVTQALWKAVMNGKNPSDFQGDDRPVEQVSWDDAQGFIKILNNLTQSSRPIGHIYRLPAEAEWEYAARGGKYHVEGYKYAGSNRLKEAGWYVDNSDNGTKPVGLKYSNQLGIHDMSGNVYGWCADDWHENYEGAPDDGKAWVDHPKRGSRRVLRGGAWHSSARNCRVAFRYARTPGHRGNGIGFRLVLALQSVG